MMTAMAATSLLCFLYGILPDYLYRQLPYAMDYRPFSIRYLVEATQIVIFTFLGFWAVRAKLAPKNHLSLDTDWFFRASAPLFRRVFVGWVNTFFAAAERRAFDLAHGVSTLSANPIQVLRSLHSPTRDFDPDLDRPALGVTIVLTLLTLVIVAAWSLLA
jgi:multicomponent Na+:H+ antiporter subunit D